MSDVGAPAGASRRALLRGAGAALAGFGALGVAGCGSSAATQTVVEQLPLPLMAQDIQILTRALELERRTVAAYVAGIPLLPHPQARMAEQFLSEELEHTGELIGLIRSAGGKPQPRANSYDLGHPRDAGEVVALLHRLERMQIAAYIQAIPRLSPGVARAGVASILTVDSQHLTMLRLTQGQTPVPAAFVSGAE